MTAAASGTLNGAQNLTLESGLGNIFFTGGVGMSTRLAAVTINAAANVTIGGGNLRTNSFNQAVAGTGACFSIVLWLYSMKVLRATPVFVKVITAAMLGIMALYLVDLVAGLFGTELGLIRGSSAMAIGISAVIVVVASLCFVIDFAAIEESIEQGADAKQGWHFAFSLLMGLVWLYLSILRLLTNLRGRD